MMKIGDNSAAIGIPDAGFETPAATIAKAPPLPVAARAALPQPNKFAPALSTAFETLNTTHIAQLASTAIESARVTLSMPLRPGLAYLPVSSSENLEINIPRGSAATITAQVGQGPDGPVLTSAKVRFEPGFVINNLSALDHRMRVRIGQLFVTATMNGISIDAKSKPTIDGTLEHPLGTDPLSQHAPQPPSVETRLLRYLDGKAQTPAMPGMPAPDPHKLVKALGSILADGTFDVQVTSKPLSGTVELDPKSPGVRVGGIGIKQDDGKLTVNACGLDAVRSTAAALSMIVGSSVQFDGQVSAGVKGTMHIAVNPQGDLDVSAKKVTATVTSNGAKVSSDKLSLELAEGAKATAEVESVALGPDGVVIKDPSGKVDMKLASGSLVFGNRTLKQA